MSGRPYKVNCVKYKGYYTGLIAIESKTTAIYRGKGWKIKLVPPDRFSATKSEGRELFIEAVSREAAQRVLNLVCNLYQMCFGVLIFEDFPNVRPVTEKMTWSRKPDNSFEYFGAIGFPLACKMAVKASYRRDYVYAASLLSCSQKLHSNDVMDLEPHYFPYAHRSPLPVDHVRFAYAIVLAYAVIEQLGLELRASAQKPSKIKGEWNPVVKDELVARLRKAHVHLDDPQFWLVRGGKTKIENGRPKRQLRRVDWTCGNIHDCNIDIVDAIAEVSWLRSKISAHRLKDDVRLLSVHDVANAQGLAIRLLMEVLGCWEPITMKAL